jgi:hypothetical protein
VLGRLITFCATGVGCLQLDICAVRGVVESEYRREARAPCHLNS